MTIHLCIQIKQVEIFKFFQTMLTGKNSQSLFFNKSKTVVPSLTEIIDMPINVLNVLHQGIQGNGNTFRGDSSLNIFFYAVKQMRSHKVVSFVKKVENLTTASIRFKGQI